MHSCRESKGKSPLYRMKASEDYPLTMKCDDPPSPSDTGRVQLNIALGTKPWIMLCEDSRVHTCNQACFFCLSFCHIKHLPYSSSSYIVLSTFLNCILSVTMSIRRWMTHGSFEGFFLVFQLITK